MLIKELSFHDYQARPELNISSLKHLRRSALHFRHKMDYPEPDREAFAFGRAFHTLCFEPSSFEQEFAFFDGRRAGKAWEEFKEFNSDKTILKVEDSIILEQMLQSIKKHKYTGHWLQHGSPEVTLIWDESGVPAKGRIDYLISLGEKDAIAVGLKTAISSDMTIFAKNALKYGYDLQWAWYESGCHAVLGIIPRMIEIVIEKNPPYEVAIFEITEEILQLGHEKYIDLLREYKECEEKQEWPPKLPHLTRLVFPPWAFPDDDDDVSELGLDFGVNGA